MFSQRAVGWLVIFSSITCANTTLSLPLLIANGTTNQVVSVVTAVGRADVAAGQSVEWWCEESGTNTFYTNGVFAGGWNGQSGHSYSVFAAGDLGVTVYDKAAALTRWFFLGLSSSVIMGCLSLRAKFLKAGVNE